MSIQTIENIPIKSIKVKDRIREEMGDLTGLVESIKEKGVIQPVTIDPERRLLAGGRRIAAAEMAGLIMIPAITRKVKGNVDRKEIELYENIHRKDLHWAERARLEKQIWELKAKEDPKWTQRKQGEATDSAASMVNRRLELAEALEVIPELSEAATENDAFKALKKMQEEVVTNQLVKTAKGAALKGLKIAEVNYKIGDALKEIHKLQPETYNFCEVDPPYAIDLKKRKDRNKKILQTEKYEELKSDEYIPFITKLATESYRILRDNSFTIWWFGMSWYGDTLRILREVGFKCSDIPAIWYKGGPGQTASPDTMLGSSYETFFVARKGAPRLCTPGRSNVFEFSPVPPSQKIHPTEKPFDLMADILNTFVYPGSRIVVPLLGSGITIRAAFKTDIIAFGWDLSETNKKRFLGRVKEDIEGGIYGSGKI